MENPLFKCGRCHHLFRQFPGATPAAENAPPTGRRSLPAREPDTLEFIFPERQPAELLLVNDVAATEARSAQSPPAAPHRPAATATAPVSEAAESADAPTRVVEPLLPVIIAQSLDTETTVVASPDVAGADADDAIEDAAATMLASERLADPVANDEPELDFDESESGDDDEADRDDADGEDEAVEPFATADGGRCLRVEDTMRTPAGFGTIMRAIGTAVTGFAALALMIRVAPERTSALLGRLPVAGAAFAHERNLVTKVELSNVQGRFQRLRNARRVFVITGNARNNSAMTIERIEVAGALYGLGGSELDQKVVTTGNRTTLTDLSEAEIVLLQRLDPAIALAPGESTPFSIVFLEPPREFREFSSRVLSVRPTRRASTPPAGSSRGSVG